MSKPASTWAELEKQIKLHINSVLQNEMSEMVKEKIQEHVQTDVYDEYPQPAIYERRFLHDGSLGDIEMMDSNLIGDGILEVTDNADFNRSFAATHGGYGNIDLDKSLAENIEFGYGMKDTLFNQPRPFIEKTREEIQNTNLHTETMRKALKVRGLEVI